MDLNLKLNYFKVIITVINFTLLLAIIVGIYRRIKGFRNFITRNKEMDKKMDIILNELKNKREN